MSYRNKFIVIMIIIVGMVIIVINEINKPAKKSTYPKPTKILTKCEEMADYIKNLRYSTAHNNNDQFKYEMDRLKNHACRGGD